MQVGSRRIVVLSDEPTAAYGVAPATAPTRRYVELLVRGGGMMPRAALGGTYEAGAGPLTVVAPGSGPSDDVERATASGLGGPLCPGLPDEFVSYVQSGLGSALGSGTVLIDRAAYDPLESSGQSFRWTAELLGALFARETVDGPLDDATISEIARTWAAESG